MIKFQFKLINQELPRHYRPPAPVVGGIAIANARALPPGPAPTWAVAPARLATSARTGGSARGAGSSASGASATDRH
jgi:hypothetical protein